jgi:alpha-galactosidase
MGWNSWNHFGCDIDAEPIHQSIDAMVESGMRDAGTPLGLIDEGDAPTRSFSPRSVTTSASRPSGALPCGAEDGATAARGAGAR